MKFTHPLPVEGPAFIILSLGGLHYVDLRLKKKNKAAGLQVWDRPAPVAFKLWCTAVKWETCNLWLRYGNFSQLCLSKVSTLSRSPWLAGFCFSSVSSSDASQRRQMATNLSAESESDLQNKPKHYAHAVQIQLTVSVGFDVNTLYWNTLKILYHNTENDWFWSSPCKKSDCTILGNCRTAISGDMEEGADDFVLDWRDWQTLWKVNRRSLLVSEIHLCPSWSTKQITKSNDPAFYFILFRFICIIYLFIHLIFALLVWCQLSICVFFLFLSVIMSDC